MSESQADPAITVLIVDDNDIAREQLARGLRRTATFRVDTASNGEEAIELVERAQGNYDAIVMDQNLGDSSGTEIMKRLRADYPDLLVLMFTTQTPDAGVEALKQGAYRYLYKQHRFQPDELVITIKAMAETRRQRVRARETGWLQALVRITQQATTSSRERLLQEVAAAARDLLSGTVAIVWEIDPNDGMLHPTTCSGDVDEERCRKICIDMNSVAIQEFLSQRRPLYLADVTDPETAPFYNDDHRQAARQYRLVSLLSAPMIAENRLVGVLDVYTDSARRFTDEDKDLLQTFASQTAIALKNAELLDRAANQRLRLERLVEIGGTLIRETPGGLKLVLEKAAQIACEFTGADSTTIYPYDPSRELFYDPVSVVTYGVKDPDWQPKEKPRKRGLAAVIRELGELVVHDVETAKLGAASSGRIEESTYQLAEVRNLIQKARFMEREQIKAFVGLSLRAGKSGSTGEEEVGVMYIDFRKPHEFTDEELASIRIFANQVGSALQNARLIQQEQTQRQQADTLREVSSAISGALGLEEVADKILEELGKVIGYSAAYMQVIQGDRRQQIAGPHPGKKETAPDWVRTTISEDRLVRHIVQSKKPLIIPNTKEPASDEQALWSLRPETAGVNSWAGLPLVYADEVIGLLTLNHEKAGFYTEAMESQMVAFANQSAVFLKNARLHETFKRLVKAGQALTEGSTNVSKTLKRVALHAEKVMDCDIVKVYPIDEKSGQLRISRGRTAHKVLLVKTKTTMPRADGNTARVLAEGVLVVEDTSDNGRYPFLRLDDQSFLKLNNVKSFLGLRMRVGGINKGVMFLDYTHPRGFSTHEIEAAQIMANQAAIALANAQRYEERTEDIAALEAVNAAIAAEPLAKVMKLITEKAMDLTDAAHGTLWLLDDDEQCLSLGAASGEHPLPVTTLPLDLEKSTNVHVANTGKHYICRDVNSDPLYFKWFDDTRSTLTVPLLIHNRPIGTLHVESTRDQPFSRYDVDLLQSLANQAAISIETARLYEQRVRDVEALREINEAVVSKQLEDVLQLVVEKALEVLSGEHSTLWLLDKKTGDLELRKEGGFAIAARKQVDRIKSGQSSINMRVAETGITQIVENAAEELDFYRLYDAAKSAVTVPLKYRGEVIGTLNVESSKSAAFSKQHADLLDTFGDQASIAIENARQYNLIHEQLQRRIRELLAVNTLQHNISRLVPSDNQLDAIYQATANAMEGLMDIRNMYIALFDQETKEFEFALWYENGEPIRPEERPLVKRRHRLDERHGLTNWVIKNAEALLIERNFEAEAANRGIEVYMEIPTKCWLGAPMLLGGRVIGVIGLNNFDREGAYDQHHKKLLETIAGQAAVAIANARQYDLINNELKRRITGLEAVSRLQRKASSIKPAQ